MSSRVAPEPIRTEVRNLLLERLLSGELEPGAKINESRLALELGVSRTPLREALLRLEFEGFLRSSKGKGYTVAPLRSEAAEHLYSLVGLLEPLAVEAAGVPGPKVLAQLEAIERRRVESIRSHDLAHAVELGSQWHEVLVRECPNDELLDILAVLKRRLYRYEYILANDVSRGIGAGHDDHDRILEGFKQGDLPLALERLRDHWEQGAETRADLLRRRETPDLVPAGEARWTSLM